MPGGRSEPNRNRRSAGLLTAIGVLLALGGLALVANRIAAESSEVGDAIGDAGFGWLAVSIGAAAAGMIAIALPWRRALALLDDRASRAAPLATGEVVARYFLGEIGKYLPGGLWPVVGRGELAVRAGVSRSVAYGSVALSLGALYLAALLTAAVLFPLSLLSGGDSSAPMLLLLLVPIGLVAIHPVVLGTMVKIAEKVTRRRLEVVFPSWSRTVALVASYVPAWLLIGTATWAVARSLDPGAGWLEVSLASVLGWTAGFVIVPVPGGVGVREAAFLAVATSLPGGIAATTAVIARVLFMVTDAGGAVVASLWLGVRARARTAATGPDGGVGASPEATAASPPGPADAGSPS